VWLRGALRVVGRGAAADPGQEDLPLRLLNRQKTRAWERGTVAKRAALRDVQKKNNIERTTNGEN
jgi:hypothetical protein